MPQFFIFLKKEKKWLSNEWFDGGYAIILLLVFF
jgi:hypothetical protein